MASSDIRNRRRAKRILLARTRILSEHGFYGLLLMHMKFALGDEFDTAWVSSETITFNPEFLDELTDNELCFVLEHEILHAALDHLGRKTEGKDHLAWNLACDIVVNSNILRSNGMDIASITLHGDYGESFHIAPNGKEGYLYTAEEVYTMLLAKKQRHEGGASRDGSSGNRAGEGIADEASSDESGTRDGTSMVTIRAEGKAGRWDWHVPSSGNGRRREEDGSWAQRIKDAVESMRARDPSGTRGLIPLCAERALDELRDSKADWRELLSDFMQEEVHDYSFISPDRRFPESPFVLPSFSDADFAVRNVLFMVDTSASVTDDMLASAYSEVKGAIDQLDGNLDGWLGFFDAAPYGPWRFDDVVDLLAIRPKGGGGTRFEAAFECLGDQLDADGISCIVILTDGLAPYPDKRIARGIPVLWMLSANISRPPWGRMALLDSSKPKL